jgi:hypothetical protein
MMEKVEMRNRTRNRPWIAAGVLAAMLFAAASPAYAWGHDFRVFARPHVRAHFFARPFIPHVRFFPRARFFARPHLRAHFFARPFIPHVRFFPRARFYYSYPVVGAYAYGYPHTYPHYAAPQACYPRAVAVYPY